MHGYLSIFNKSHGFLVVLNKVFPFDFWLKRGLFFEKLCDLVLRIVKPLEEFWILLLELVELVEVKVDSALVTLKHLQ